MIKKTVLLGALACSSLIMSINAAEKTSQNDLIFAMPLSNNIEMVYPDGSRTTGAKFIRNSKAVDQKFEEVKSSIPRFYTITGTKGLLIENGSNSWKHTSRGSNNALLPDTASCETLNGFKLIGKAKTSLITGMQGTKALEISSTLANDAIETIPVDLLTTENQLASFYIKSASSAELTVAIKVITDKETKIVAKKTFKPENDWKRQFIYFKSGLAKKGKGKVQLIFSTSLDKTVVLDALMVEQCGIYMGRHEPSSWISGGANRASETLLVPLADNKLNAGTISFDFIPTATGGWSCLFCNGSGWKPIIRISIKRNGTRLAANIFGKLLRKDIKFIRGKKYNIALSWDKKNATLYCNGSKVAQATLATIKPLDKSISIGGSPDNTSPNIKADGIFSNFSIWKRKLNDDEIKNINKSLDLLLKKDNGLSLLTPSSVFARDMKTAQIVWSVKKKVSSVIITLSGFKPKVIKAQNGIIKYVFSPALLMPGKYSLSIKTSDNNKFDHSFKIVPARTPWTNLQVCTWNESGNYAPYGVTVSGISGFSVNVIDKNTSQGLYSQDNIIFLGTPRDKYNKKDWAKNPKGKNSFPNIFSPAVMKSIKEKAQYLANYYKYMPNIKAAVLNSEKHAGSVRLNYSPAMVKYIKKRFGLDLNKWLKSDLSPWHLYQPMGYLSTRPVPELVPADRVIPLNNKLYAFLRWWHSDKGASDIVTNDIIAEAILKVRPDFLIMKDPILRRPQLRSYRKINIAQDWVYYGDPKNILSTVEGLQSCIRGNKNMMASTMPQFLLKPGMAAPFSGMPTADMFREACWLACSRPARLMTFWNFRNAITKAKKQTAKELNKILGDQFDYEQTKTIIKQKKIKLSAWEPGLAKEFKSLSDNLWKPFGGLLPRWKNAPRRLAVIRSFAANIFGNIRWRKYNWLYKQTVTSGIPFDILWDEDFENGVKTKYDLIVFPNCYAMTEPMFSYLKTFIEEGGTVVVDEQYRVNLPGAVKLKGSGEKIYFTDMEAKLLKKYSRHTEHPQYIEAMEQLVQQTLHNSLNSSLQKILRLKIKNTVSCRTNAVCWNLLKAAGADYLVTVNDLRIPGKLYGRYGKVKEKGIAQKVIFKLKNNRWKHAYDLMSHNEVNIKKKQLALALPASGGSIIMFTSKPIGKLSISSPEKIIKGQFNKFKISLTNLCEGLIPIKIDFIKADGKLSSLSHYNVIRNSELKLNFPMAVNAKSGKWILRVKEFATGKTAKYKFNVE